MDLPLGFGQLQALRYQLIHTTIIISNTLNYSGIGTPNTTTFPNVPNDQVSQYLSTI